MVATILNTGFLKCDVNLDNLHELANAVIKEGETYMESDLESYMRSQSVMFEKKASSTSSKTQSLDELRKKTGLIEVLLYFIQNKRVNLMGPEEQKTFADLEARYKSTIPKVRDEISTGKVDKAMKTKTQALLKDTHALLDKLDKNSDTNKLNEMSINIFEGKTTFNVRPTKKISGMLSRNELIAVEEDFCNYLKEAYLLYENAESVIGSKTTDKVLSKKMGLVEVMNHYIRNNKEANMFEGDKSTLSKLEETYRNIVPEYRTKLKAKQSLSEEESIQINSLLKNVKTLFDKVS